MSTEDDKVNSGALATLVAVGLFAMISITSAVTALVRHEVSEAQSEKDTDANVVVAELKASQKATLAAPPHYLNPAAGKVAVPIDMAASLVVNELRRDPNSATPAPPPPAPVESAAPASDAPTDKATDAKGDKPKGDKKPPQPGSAPQHAPAAPAPAPNH